MTEEAQQAGSPTGSACYIYVASIDAVEIGRLHSTPAASGLLRGFA